MRALFLAAIATATAALCLTLGGHAAHAAPPVFTPPGIPQSYFPEGVLNGSHPSYGGCNFAPACSAY